MIIDTELNEDERIQQILYMYEAYYGKVADLQTVYMFEVLLNRGVSVELFEYGMEYCIRKSIRSPRYLASVLTKWCEQGAVSVEDVKRLIDENRKKEKIVTAALGREYSQLSNAEEEYIERWFQMGLPEELILEACNMATLKTKSNRFAYADAILESWKRNNINSIEDFERFQEAEREKRMHRYAAYSNRNIIPESQGATVVVPVHEERHVDYSVPDLKPCPFCGATMIGVQSQFSSKSNSFYIVIFCNRCGCRTRSSNMEMNEYNIETCKDSQNIAELRHLWNSRA